MMTFQLENKVIDIITGFKGMVIARAEYLLENNVYRVQPMFKKYKDSEAKWIAEDRLALQ